jgi:hypothetical protein
VAASRCTATTKAGAPCVIGAVAGSEFCAAHDTATRQEAAAAGGHARGRRPGYLSHDEAERAVVFTSRADIKATLERLSRHVVAGELEAKSVNATILAANGALAVMNDEDKQMAKRAAAMTDDELEAALEADFRERQARKASK